MKNLASLILTITTCVTAFDLTKGFPDLPEEVHIKNELYYGFGPLAKELQRRVLLRDVCEGEDKIHPMYCKSTYIKS
jgi:hypothetical protein